MQPIMGKLLRAALDDTSSVDVRDRALLYYRLLRHCLAQAQQIFSAEKEPVGAFTEETHVELFEELLAEFNTLAVLYGLPSHRFPRPPIVELRPAKAGSSGSAHSAHSNMQAIEPAAKMPSVQVEQKGSLVLRPRVAMESRVFQEKWSALPVAQSWEAPLSTSADWSNIEARMSEQHIMCIASGSVGSLNKYYFFAQEGQSSRYFLVEVLGDVGKGRLTARFKAEVEKDLPHFTRHFKLALSRALDTKP